MDCLITQKIDLSIIYDASESMGLGENLAILKKYIYRIVQLFDVQSDPNKGTRVIYILLFYYSIQMWRLQLNKC